MKTMYKKSLAGLLGLVMAAALLTGCGSTDGSSQGATTAPSTGTTVAEKTKVNVVGINGPTGVGLVNLWKAAEDGTAANEYAMQTVTNPNDIVGKISTGAADIAAVPTNMAALLYKKTNKQVSMLAVNTLGVLYMVEDGHTVQSVKDLKGKTIYSTGQGANPEYVLKYILEKNGLDPAKDVKIEFLQENEELATQIATGKAKVALVPEPVLTTVMAKKEGLRTALDMTAEWDKAAGGNSKLMMGCVIVRNAFLKEHPEAVKAFLTEYKASIEKTESDLAGTAALCARYGIIANETVAKKAIPHCNITFVSGADMKAQIKGYFEVLLAANPQSVGGELPDDAFYYLG